MLCNNHNALRQGISFGAAVTVCVILLCFAGSAKTGVSRGIDLCGQLVIPSLFPFMCMCEWLSSAQATAWVSSAAAKVTRPLLKGYAPGAFALLLCGLGGYPMGAAALSGAGQMPDSCRRRLALVCFCPSPAFVISGIGGLLGSARAGLVLYAGCLASQWLTAWVLCRIWPLPPWQFSSKNTDPLPLASAVAQASVRCLALCGAVLFASAFRRILTDLPLPAGIGRWVPPLLEVTAGVDGLLGSGVSLPALGAVLCFGGFSTHLQVLGLMGSNAPSFWQYESVRLLQTGLCFGLLFGFCRCFPQTVSSLAFGAAPVAAPVSPLPAAALLATVGLFLLWLGKEVLP